MRPPLFLQLLLEAAVDLAEYIWRRFANRGRF